MVQFASYVRRVLHKTRLIFSRINGPNKSKHCINPRENEGIFLSRLIIINKVREKQSGGFVHCSSDGCIMKIENIMLLKDLTQDVLS